jgi:hypothetical protein
VSRRGRRPGKDAAVLNALSLPRAASLPSEVLAGLVEVLADMLLRDLEQRATNATSSTVGTPTGYGGEGA